MDSTAGKLIATALRTVYQGFGITPAAVAADAGITIQNLEEIAAGKPLGNQETDRLLRTLRLAKEPHSAGLYETPTDDEPVRMLTLRREFIELDEESRLRVFQLSQDARNLESLQYSLSQSSSWERFIEARDKLDLPRPDATLLPWQQGEKLAIALRRTLNLGNQPVASMRNLVKNHFPGLTLLDGLLGHNGPEGILFADKSRGVTVVLNQAIPKNRLPWVRRFNLAHELGHALTDIGLRRPMAHVSRHMSDSQFEVEQRANAFAAYFLCPRNVLLDFVDQFQDSRKAVEHVVVNYGLPYTTVRTILKNVANLEVPPQPASELDLDRWQQMESEPSLEEFPLNQIPMEYRSNMARMATELFLLASITRDQYAWTLGLDSDSSVVIELPRLLFGPGCPAVLFSELREILVANNIEIDFSRT
ncbi:MAG: ImmA/IrrE family metallo-endopeptidase [Magnetococcus sp. DMHC-1]|nr:ImmA/IrrE family metallo-endopeptidase [Magnetococcales bacterium]